MSEAAHVVVQSRLGSRRLPGKALLPIAGMPAAVLAARRAGRAGSDVVLATSTDPSDDPIANACRMSDVRCFRGSLHDVYRRFLDATLALPGEAVVVRLTADNVFPDSDLVEDHVDLLRSSGADYAVAEWPECGLPYGVVAEAFRLGALRRHAPERPGDAEHVTPALRRSGRAAFLKVPLGLERLRATIDSLDDYVRICRVFENVDDPVGVGWRALCDALDRLPDAPVYRVPARRVMGELQSALTLGTVQLGMPYGIANRSGTPDSAQARRIIYRAIAHGITHLDTARSYRESETRIGEALARGYQGRITVITKLAPIMAGDAAMVRAVVEASVFRSCRELQTNRLELLLLHASATRKVAGGAAWECLLELQAEGVIGRLGISVQSPEEAHGAYADPNVSMLQLPFNLLDHRWNATLTGRDDVLIHARSTLLQGLLTGAEPAIWPKIAGLDVPALISTLRDLARELNREDLTELALAFVRGQPWIHSIVLGMETEAQLDQNLAYFARPALTAEETALIRDRLPRLPENLLNPALWPRP